MAGSKTHASVADLVTKLHTNIDSIHATLSALNSTSSAHQAELERLSAERENKIAELRASYESTLKEVAAKRQKDEEELAEQRKREQEELEAERQREYEEMMARRKREDEEREKLLQEREAERLKMMQEDDAKREAEREETERSLQEKVERELELLEDEMERKLEEGREALRALDESRKAINAEIDTALNTPTVIPPMFFRSRAKTSKSLMNGTGASSPEPITPDLKAIPEIEAEEEENKIENVETPPSDALSVVNGSRDISSKEEGTPASISDPFNIPEPEPSESTPHSDNETREIPVEEESTPVLVPEEQATKEVSEGDFGKHAPAETIVENVEEIHLDSNESSPTSEPVFSEAHDESLPEAEIPDLLEEHSVKLEEDKETQPVHAFTEPGPEPLVDDASRIETEEKIVDSPPTELEPTINDINPEEGDVHVSTNESGPVSELRSIGETLDEAKDIEITEAPKPEISNEIEVSENVHSESNAPARHTDSHTEPLDADEVIPELRDLDAVHESDSLEAKDLHVEESHAAEDTSEPKELLSQPAQDDNSATVERRDLDSALESSTHGLEHASDLPDEDVTSGLDHSEAGEPTNTELEQINPASTLEENGGLVSEPQDLDAQPEASPAHDPLPREDSNVDKDQDLSSSSSEAIEAEPLTHSHADDNGHPQIEESTLDKSEELGGLEKLVEQSEVESGETVLPEPQNELLDGSDVLGDEGSGVAGGLSAEVESDKGLDDLNDHSVISGNNNTQDIYAEPIEEVSIETDATSMEASEHFDSDTKSLDPPALDEHLGEVLDQSEHKETPSSISRDSPEALHELAVEHESPKVLETPQDIETLDTEIPNTVQEESESSTKVLTDKLDENELPITNDNPVHEEPESSTKDLTDKLGENELPITNDDPVHEEPAPFETHEDHLSEIPSMLQAEVAKDTITDSGNDAEVDKPLPEDIPCLPDTAEHSISGEIANVVPDSIHEEKLPTPIDEAFPESIPEPETSEIQDADRGEIGTREISTGEEDLTPDISNILEHYQSAEDNARDISTDDEFESALSEGGSTSQKHEDVVEDEHPHQQEVSEAHDTVHALVQDLSEPTKTGEIETSDIEAGEIEISEIEAGEIEISEIEADEIEAGDIETGDIEAAKENNIQHIHDAETVTETLPSGGTIIADEGPASIEEPRIEEPRIVEEHTKPEVISEEECIGDSVAPEEGHSDGKESHIEQQLNHEAEHLQEPIAPSHAFIEETSPLEVQEREAISEPENISSEDIMHHQVTHSEPPQDNKEAESEPMFYFKSTHKEGVMDDDESPSQVVDRGLDLPVFEISPKDIPEPVSAPSHSEHLRKENEHPESVAHLSESPIVPLVESQGPPAVETFVSNSKDGIVLGDSSGDSNEAPLDQHSSELESKDESHETKIPAQVSESEENSVKSDFPLAPAECDISPEIHGASTDEKVNSLEVKEISSDFQEYLDTEGVSLTASASEEELTPRALPLDSEGGDLTDVSIDELHLNTAQGSGSESIDVFEFLEPEDSESPESMDDPMDEGSLKDGAPLNGSTGPEDSSLEDEAGILTPNQHHIIAESVLNTDDLFDDDTDSDSSDRSEESDADGEEDEDDDGEEDEETYDSDGSDSEEEEEDSDAPVPISVPSKIERSFPHVVQNMPSYEFGKPKMVDPFSEQSNEQVDFSSSHRSSGLFASLVDTIKSDLPVVKKMANNGGPRSPRGENDYAASESKEVAPAKVVVPNAFQQTDTEEDAAFYDSFSDHQPSSSHVRSQTAETVPSFVSYAQSDADSAASETLSSQFQDVPPEEPRVASSVALSHVLEEPRDLEQEASPLRAEFDPYGSNTYPKYITPKQSQANLRSPVKTTRSSRNDRFVVSQSIVTTKTQYGPRGTPSPRSRRFSVSTTTIEARPSTPRTMSMREKRLSQDSLPSPTLKRTTTDQNLPTVVPSNRPISSPSPPSNSFFQKTRSLFENTSGQTTQAPQTITRPLSGYFNGRGSPSPSPQLHKKGSMASLRSRPSSLYQGDPGAPLSEEDIVPRNLDGNGKPPSPAFTIPNRRDSMSAQRERKSSHGSMNRVENDINVFTPSKGIRPRGNSSFTGIGLGKLVGGERGLDDSVHNPERERVPLLVGEGEEGGVGVRDRS